MRPYRVKPLDNTAVFSAGLSLSGHISAPAKLPAPASDGSSSDFWLLRRRRAGARQGEKGKKRRKDTLAGVFALVNRWYRKHRRARRKKRTGRQRLTPLPAHTKGQVTLCTGERRPHTASLFLPPLQMYWRIPSVATSSSALTVTVNFTLLFSLKQSSQWRNFSTACQSVLPAILHRLSTNTWEIS